MANYDPGSIGHIGRFPHEQSDYDSTSGEAASRARSSTPTGTITPDRSVSRTHVYSGTVFEFKGNLSQQILGLLKPQIENAAIAGSDSFFKQIEHAKQSLRHNARRKKSRACGLAADVLEEESQLRDLLYSYRNALYSG